MPTGVYERTSEMKVNMRNGHFGKKNKPMSEQGRRNIASAAIGRKHSEETKAKMSVAKKGKTPANFQLCLQKAHENVKNRIGDKASNWKGDNVGYSGVHQWIQKILGKPNCCDRCGTTKAKRYEWANISRLYKRVVSDWERLCVSCHRKDGYAKGEYTPLFVEIKET